MDLSLFGQSRDAERRRPAAHPVLAPGSPTPRARGPTRRSTQLNTLLWIPQSGASEDGHFLSLRRTQTLHSPGHEKSLNLRGFLSAMGSFVHYFSPIRKSEEPIPSSVAPPAAAAGTVPPMPTADTTPRPTASSRVSLPWCEMLPPQLGTIRAPR